MTENHKDGAPAGPKGAEDTSAEGGKRLGAKRGRPPPAASAGYSTEDSEINELVEKMIANRRRRMRR